MPDTPAGFSADVWMPMGIGRGGYFGNDHVFPMIARLAPGSNAASAEREIERLTPRLPERIPDAYSAGFFRRYGFRTRVTPLKEAVVGEMARNLWILFGAVGLVLVMACANVANLFVVRAESRRRELAIRAALGAGRVALGRLLLAEGLSLSLVGSALAPAVGFWGVPALVSMAPDSLPRADALGMDAGTVAFTLLTALLAGVVLAVDPLVRHLGAASTASLGMGGRTSTPGRAQQRLRSGLVVVQVALALTLVAGTITW